ncbi:MAG: 6-carboxytetrahydropterin synthase [Proteobacteria bacterium]|nr:6-carboxytetrahydropterin synthase [Pseudomonadota bacterium]
MFTATKHIHVSYGHRIPAHGSVCRSPHGHTGRIEATCAAAQLPAKGEQTDMVVDFGFLQKLMMDVVHAGINAAPIL